jgi:glucose/arabinose dehydrogenase
MACGLVIALMVLTTVGISCRRSSGPVQGQVRIWLTLFASGFVQPVHITHAGDGSGRLFIVEQCGRVRIVKNGVVQSSPFLDIPTKVSCGGERGLLSIAFPGAYDQTGRFYVYYTSTTGDIVIARYQRSADPEVADPATEEILLTIPHPTHANHNGGQLAFGPDGYLYIGTGDGGGGGDPGGNAQNPLSLLGKILRIHVETGTSSYAVPPDNPFDGDPASRGEIWALGLRNPWRFSFDRITGDLFIADVGQGTFEEVNFRPAQSSGGENYGWNIMEGSHCFAGAACDQTGLTPPVHEYDHTMGCSVTGGFVSRDPAAVNLWGRYLFGDFCSGRIWALQRMQSGWDAVLAADTAYFLSTFGEDESGHLYAADYGAGTIYRITGN